MDRTLHSWKIKGLTVAPGMVQTQPRDQISLGRFHVQWSQRISAEMTSQVVNKDPRGAGVVRGAQGRERLHDARAWVTNDSA